jgi:hypothetical protein
MGGREEHKESQEDLHTMLNAVLSTSLVSGGKLAFSSETVAPSRAAFCVVQYMGMSKILPSRDLSSQYQRPKDRQRSEMARRRGQEVTYSPQSSSAPLRCCAPKGSLCQHTFRAEAPSAAVHFRILVNRRPELLLHIAQTVGTVSDQGTRASKWDEKGSKTDNNAGFAGSPGH